MHSSHHTTGNIWIGAYDQFSNDVLYQLDGTAVDDGYTNYYEPFIDGGDHDAIYLIYGYGWQWGDEPPSLNYAVLCEIDI